MKPILFNTDMVRAILDGRKTVTRRPVKPQPILNGHFYEWAGAGWSDNIKRITPVYGHSMYHKAPYQPGDILYVRETWSNTNKHFSHLNPEYIYRADIDDPLVTWSPSIHMPREAARLFLRATGVRVERLQEITTEGARAEGLPADNEIRNPDPATHESIKNWNLAYAQHLFRELWDSVYSKRGYGWEQNPWVWVITFERCQP